jgi:acyl carrier protein
MATPLAEALTRFIQEEIVFDDVVVAGDSDLLLSGAVDSLGVIRVTHWMEETTGVVVDPGDVTLDNFQTVNKMVSYLDARVQV